MSHQVEIQFQIYRNNAVKLSVIEKRMKEITVLSVTLVSLCLMFGEALWLNMNVSSAHNF